MTRLCITLVCIAALVFTITGCHKSDDSPPQAVAPSSGPPRTSLPSSTANVPQPVASQSIPSQPQPPAVDPRRLDFQQRELPILAQIRQNEEHQAVLKAEIEKAGSDIEIFNYSGRSVSENPYYDIKIQKTEELEDTLKQRLALDDQLKELYAQYPDFAH